MRLCTSTWTSSVVPPARDVEAAHADQAAHEHRPLSRRGGRGDGGARPLSAEWAWSCSGYLATPQAVPWLVGAAVLLAVGCALSLFEYSTLIGAHVHVKEEVVDKRTTREIRVLGGRELLPEAAQACRDLGRGPSDLLQGLVLGTSALTGASFATRVVLTKKAPSLRCSREWESSQQDHARPG